MRGLWLAVGVVVALAGCSSAKKSESMFGEAESYERFMGRWSHRLASPFVEFARVGDLESVLDVGAGTGELSFALRNVDRQGMVTAVDLSPEYIAYAKQHQGSAAVNFVVGDAQKLPFASTTFDDALALLVINFVPDPMLAVREMARVTKPGGMVAAAVWDYGDQMEMLRVFWDAAVSLDPAAEPRDEKHMKLCRDGELAALWTQAGLKQVVEQPATIALHFASFDDYWQPFLLGQGPAGAYVKSLGPEARARLEQKLRDKLGDHPFDLKARAWFVRGLN